MSRRFVPASLALLLIAACSGAPAPTPAAPPPAAPATGTADSAFTTVANRLYWAHFDFRPQLAIKLGYHQYDGKVPDRSAAAITAEISRLRAGLKELEAIDPQPLSRSNRMDREILLTELRKELFSLAVLRQPQRSPVYYLLFSFSLEPYIDRDYAPLPQRAKALLTACRAAPTYYQQMRANLEDSLPKPALQVSLMMTDGTVALVDKVIREKMAALPEGQLRTDVDACLDTLVGELKALHGDLAARMPHATDDFALGEELFHRMLVETQGIDVDVATLERIGQADLERNLAAIQAAAKQIDPNRPVREVIAEAAKDKPDDLLGEATAQVKAMRAFVLDQQIASIPGNDQVEVRYSPPHKRSNMAFLSSAGPFERRALPSFYYISPPNPSWPEAEQRAYLPSKADLLFLTTHEVWPGHFLQGRHVAAYATRIGRTFETYTTTEGWAHYAEEMMWDAGLGNGDPRVHIGQLKNALLRNVRFMVAIGMHCRGMTVDQAIQMFQDKAYADAATARQQAMRGTGDPMYLSYTLGKLIIQKMHRDWKAAQGDAYTLKGFHDAFLHRGKAPLAAIRRDLLGPDAGPLL